VNVVVLVVTHGSAGTAMLAALEALLGEAAVAAFEAIEVRVGEPKASIWARLCDAVMRHDPSDGILVMTDLHGSTPTNCALELCRQAQGRRLVVITGVSLPMLVKVATARPRASSPAELAHLASETAVRSIRIEGEEQEKA